MTNFEGAKLCDWIREMREKLCKGPSQINRATSRQQSSSQGFILGWLKTNLQRLFLRLMWGKSFIFIFWL